MTNYKYFCEMFKKAGAFDDEETFYETYKECFPEETLADDIFKIAKGGIKAMRALTIDSQAAFAERMGVPMRTLQKWETGEREPAPYTVTMMAYIFLNQRTEDKTLKQWVIIDRRGDEFETALPAMTREEAVYAANLAWEKMSDYDRKKCEAFFVGCMVVDEDGCVDLDTMMDVVTIK